MNCPICTTPMPARHSNGYPPVVCSKTCQLICLSWGRHMRAQYEEIDTAVVDRLISGQRVDSIRRERVAATQWLTRWGRSLTFIAAQLHVSRSAVFNYRRDSLLQNGVQV